MPMRAIVMSLVVAMSLMVLALPYEGAAMAASGVAYVGSLEAGAQQTFIVQVNAAVADGTQLLVFTNGLPAGTVTVAGGMATLDLSTVNGALPAGVDPVCEIGPIWVTDADQKATLLLGPEIN